MDEIQTPPLKAFVIGPIGDRDAPHDSSRRVVYEEAVQVLEEIVVPACEALGVQALRADQISRVGDITEQIFRLIRDSHIVIADLTGANPNVMYELGLRHSTGKLTIQIGERERLPFDVATIRTIMFKRTAGGLVEARRALIQALAVSLKDGGDPVAATRVWFEESVPATTLELEKCANQESEDDRPGFLEAIADTEDGIQILVQVLGTATSIVEEVARICTDGATKISALQSAQGVASAKLVIANRVAALLEEPSTRLNIAAQDYAQSVTRIEPGLHYMLEQLANDPDQLNQVPDFPKQIQQLVTGATESIPSILDFRAAFEGMSDATRSMRQVTNRLSVTLLFLSETSKRISSWQAYLDRLVAPNN